MNFNYCRVYLLAAALLATGGATARADYISAVEALNPIDYWRFETADRKKNDGSNSLEPSFSATASNTTTDTLGPSSANGFFGFGSGNNALRAVDSNNVGVAPAITFPKTPLPNYIPVAPGVAHTLNFWVKPDSFAPGSGNANLRAALVYGGDPAPDAVASRYNRIRVQFASDGLLAVDVNFSTANTDAAGPKVAFGQWNMITVVVPPSPGQVKDLQIYLNGQLLTNTSTNTNQLQIGSNSNGTLLMPTLGGPFTLAGSIGAYDELAFFGTALTGEQIAGLYQAALTPVPEPASGLLLAGGALAAGCLVSRKRRTRTE